MPTHTLPPEAVLSLVLPAHTLDWFDITDTAATKETITITLVEKNNPPAHRGTLVFKGYKDITVTDFPVRGKRTELTFRRRYWSIQQMTENLVLFLLGPLFLSFLPRAAEGCDQFW